MGKIKTAVFAAVGIAFIAPIVPNFLAGEFSSADCGIAFLGGGIALFPVAAYAVRKRSVRCYRVLSIFCYCILGLVLTVAAALTAVMIPAAHDDLSGAGSSPVIVPGCLLRGDEPGEMLKNRLDTARAYLSAHPDARCVVCGGYIGRYTQAGVMKAYLEKNGVAPSRILADDRSDTTYENLYNAKKLLGGAGKVVIATDVYHQYRAKFYARSLGFSPLALPSPTPLRHIVDAWLREYMAVFKAWITRR